MIWAGSCLKNISLTSGIRMSYVKDKNRSTNKGKKNSAYIDGRTMKTKHCRACEKALKDSRSTYCNSCKQKEKRNSNYNKIWYSKSKKDNPNWKNGISNQGYSYKFNNKLKQKILKRDSYTCQLCNKKEDLTVHHIDYNKQNCEENNLIVLCRNCNSKVNFNRNYWTNYFTLICLVCHRRIPNINHITKNGCKFCDGEYYLKKKKETLDN